MEIRTSVADDGDAEVTESRDFPVQGASRPSDDNKVQCVRKSVCTMSNDCCITFIEMLESFGIIRVCIIDVSFTDALGVAFDIYFSYQCLPWMVTFVFLLLDNGTFCYCTHVISPLLDIRRHNRDV